MHRTIIRAALICGATGIALGIWAAVDDTAARANDHDTGLLPAAVDLAGDLADAPVRTVEQTPRPATKLTQTAPTPVRAAVEPVERILDTAVDTVQPPTKTHQPAAAPPKQLRAPATTPASEAVPAVVLLTGAAPSTVTVDPARAADRPAAAAYTLPCDGDAGVPAGSLRHRSTPSPDRTRCTSDGRSDTPTGLAQIKPPTNGVDQLAATTPTSPATPALRLLGELLPRSDLPTGRATPPEPGPA